MLPTILPQIAARVDHDEKEQILADLIAESHAHPALNHVWLETLAASGYDDMHWVVQDYAREYSGYSVWFPHYLRTVIDKLEDPAHKDLLLHNLEEEQGHMGDDDKAELAKLGIDPATVDGVPHPQLYRRFCRAVGVADEELELPSYAAAQWRDRFLRFLENATPAAAVGALGLGTENVVKPIYRKLLSGVKGLGTLRREDYVFFELHCTVDDQHALDLHEVAKDLLVTAKNRHEMRLGMLEALDLRNGFWNHLHRRASGVLRVSA